MSRHAFRRYSMIATACALGFGAAAVPATASSTETPDVRPAQATQYSAVQVRALLIAFYGQHGPSRADREHKVTEELQRKAAETEGYDLLLCAQNAPQSISVGRATTAQSAGVGWSTVTTKWKKGPDRHFTAYVGLDTKRPMQLLDISCGDERKK